MHWLAQVVLVWILTPIVAMFVIYFLFVNRMNATFSSLKQSGINTTSTSRMINADGKSWTETTTTIKRNPSGVTTRVTSVVIINSDGSRSAPVIKEDIIQNA